MPQNQKPEETAIISEETTVTEGNNGDLAKKLVGAAVAFGFAAVAAASAAFVQSRKTRTVEKVEVAVVDDEIVKKTTTKKTTKPTE